MNNKTILTAMYDKGRADALDLQNRAGGLTGTELNAEDAYIPEFSKAVKVMNMLDRPAGRVVRLIQNYDSDFFTQEPEELPAQFGFVWSTDPAKAQPFIALSTSPYNTGDCCIENGAVYRSKFDNNVHAPSAYPAGWEAAE